MTFQLSLKQWLAVVNGASMRDTRKPRCKMNSLHIQTIHSDAIRAGHVDRAERHRSAASARAARPGARERLRAVAVAFRRPELVTAPRPRAATAPRGC